MTAPMTTPEHTRNGRIALPLGMLLLTLCFLYLGISAWQERDRTWRAPSPSTARRSEKASMLGSTDGEPTSCHGSPL